MRTPPQAVGIDCLRCLLSRMAGEVLPYVQGESLKGSAAVLWRFLNSPVTSAAGDRSTTGGVPPMVRRPGPKPPLAQVESLVDAAVTIIEAYWRDETFRPTQSDLELLGDLDLHLQRAGNRMGRLASRLRCRFRAEPGVNRHSWDG